jgi:hypothetical protein
MIRTKDAVHPPKRDPHLQALDALIVHDVGAGEVLALLLDKLKSKGVDNVQEQSSCYQTALITLPHALKLVNEAIKQSLIEFGAKMQPPPTQKLDELEFDLVTFIQRCETFTTSTSPLLRDQLAELSSVVLPMSIAACPDCTLPPTAAELEAAALAALLESTNPSSQPKPTVKLKGGAPNKQVRAKAKPSTKK